MKKILSLGLGLLALGMTSPAAFAQREAPTRQERRQQRQQETANMTPEQRTQFRQQRFQERMRNATPEQRARMQQRMQEMQERMRAQGLDPNDPNAMRQMMQQRGGWGGNGGAATPAAREAQRRQMMVTAGISDKAAQDAILEFIVGEERARQPLLQLARAAAAALAPATPEADMTSAFEAYTTALEADKVRHEKALADLDARINFSTSPRLKAFMALVGLSDNSALALGGAPAIFNLQAGGGQGGGGRGGNGPRQARDNNGAANAAPAAGAATGATADAATATEDGAAQ